MAVTSSGRISQKVKVGIDGFDDLFLLQLPFCRIALSVTKHLMTFFLLKIPFCRAPLSVKREFSEEAGISEGNVNPGRDASRSSSAGDANRYCQARDIPGTPPPNSSLGHISLAILQYQKEINYSANCLSHASMKK